MRPLVLLGAMLSCGEALAQVQFQQVATGSGSGSSLTVTLPTAVPTGDLLVVGLETQPLGVRPVVTDTAGDAFEVAAEVGDTGAGPGRVSLFYAVAKGPVSSVSIVVAGGSFIQAMAAEYAGVDAEQPLDSASACASTSFPMVEGGPYVTHWPGELVVNFVISAGVASTAEPGFTLRSSAFSDLWQDAVLATPSNVLLSGTSSNDGWVSVLAGFRPAGSAPMVVAAVPQVVAAMTGNAQLDLPFPNPVAPGGTVVAAVEWGPTTAMVTGEDPSLNPMQTASVVLGPTAGYGTAVLFLPDAGGVSSMHYSVAGGTFLQVVQLEYAGLTASPLLAESHAQSTSSTTVQSTLDAGGPGLLFSFVMSDAVVTQADPSSHTRANFFEDLVQDRVVQAAGAYVLTGADDAGRWNAHQVLFALVDAGVEPEELPDGGTDGGGGSDAGVDAGTPDGTAPPSKLGVGCDCGSGAGELTLLALAALLGRRRRARW